MGRLRTKGKAGAAKAYVTRSSAIKKLQCSLADFRRLCILKGIFPREPKHRKKANKGSSAPTSFYYAKDIAYLAHEPVLKKLREHKAFAKKISRALGRGEWGDAKVLDENKPIYRLDHIIKERYPAFIDAIRDIDDALCMIFLFASLPSNTRLPAAIIENCSRLAAEWQLYVIHSRSLRKSFLSIKGVYYQAEVLDQTITWLVPYQFTQNVPSDVDIRVMLTFLELYQTLLGFVLFKIYADAGLVYPPPLDINKAEDGAGIAALQIQPQQINPIPQGSTDTQASSKDVRKAIRDVASGDNLPTDVEMTNAEPVAIQVADDDFVSLPSKTDDTSAALPTFKALSSLPPTLSTSIFSPHTFFLSRETPRSIFEVLIKSFGGRIGWPSTSGAGSPFDEEDPSITHVIIDRPTRNLQLSPTKKYVQPQWVVDCINQGKLLLEDDYAPGKTLPPHLSPFGEYEGAYVPTAQDNADDIPPDEEMSGVNDDLNESSVVLQSVDSMDPDSVRNAEVAAEAAGVEFGAWEKHLDSQRPSNPNEKAGEEESGEEDMNKMLMSNKQKKLYQKMVYSRQKKADERSKLETKRLEIQKAKRR